MASFRARSDNKTLFFDFIVNGVRCRDQTTLPDKPANRKRLENVLQKMEAEMTLGTFDYGKFFPNSPRAEKLKKKASSQQQAYRESPLFAEFAET